MSIHGLCGRCCLFGSGPDVARVRLRLPGDLHSDCCLHTEAAACRPHNEPQRKTKPPTPVRTRLARAVAAGRGRSSPARAHHELTVSSLHLKLPTGPSPSIYLSEHVPILLSLFVVIPSELCCGPQPITNCPYRNGAVSDLRTAPCDERAQGGPPTADDVPCQGPQVREDRTTTARWSREGITTARRQRCNRNR
jgi:hypothetical protein